MLSRRKVESFTECIWYKTENGWSFRRTTSKRTHLTNPHSLRLQGCHLLEKLGNFNGPKSGNLNKHRGILYSSRFSSNSPKFTLPLVQLTIRIRGRKCKNFLIV